MENVHEKMKKFLKLETVQHPRVGVGVIVERDGQILLGKRKGSHGESTWSPPGGHLEFGESVEICAKRELLEETGLLAKEPLKLDLWTEDLMEEGKKHYISLFVVVKHFQGEPAALEPEKCEEWRWFPWDDLPEPLFLPLASLIKKRAYSEKTH